MAIKLICKRCGCSLGWFGLAYIQRSRRREEIARRSICIDCTTPAELRERFHGRGRPDDSTRLDDPQSSIDDGI